MKKCFSIRLLLFAFVYLAIIANSYSQTGECLLGGCAGGTQFPSFELSSSSDAWEIVSTAIYAGEYAIYNVESGKTYEWSLLAVDGGSSSYDSQLTLLSEDGLTEYCFSNDVHNLNAKITWTATFTGKVRVLVNEYDCLTNTEFTTLAWRCASCGSIDPPANDDCSSAISLSVFAGETCGGATNGTVLGATNSGVATCYGTANNDVWFSFVASSANFHDITVIGSSGFDAVVDLREGPSCNGINIECADNNGSGGTELISISTLTPGQTYYVRVYDYFSSVPSTADFTICVTAPTTCVPGYTSGTSVGDFVDGVALVGENATSISNLSSGGGEPYVKDYTAQSVQLKAGFSYSIDLTNGDYGGQTIGVWIDFNLDDVYSADEKIGEISNMDAYQSSELGFTVPAGAVLGTTKMLVRAVWSQTEIDPCTIYSFGEAETYTINIISPCETPGTPVSLSESAVNDNSATISWTTGSPAGSATVTYYWAIGSGTNVTYESNYTQRGTTTGISTNLSSLSAGTQYYWTVKAVTSCNGTSSAYASVDNFTTSCITPGTPTSLSTTGISTGSATLNWTAGTPTGSTNVSYYWAVNTSSTVNYETNYVQRGITTNLNTIIYNLSLNTQYYWTVKAVTDCGASSSSSYASPINFTTLSVDAPITWTGNTSTDWNTTTNWSPQQIPTVTNNVIIPSGCANYPLITTDGLSINNTTVAKRCKSLHIDNAASVTVNGSLLYIYCSGEIQISGVLHHNAGSNSNCFEVNMGGEVTVKNGGMLNIGSTALTGGLPAGTINQYNDLYINDGTLNIEPGAKVFVQDNLVLTGTAGNNGNVNMFGGELWIKYFGSGSSSDLGFDIWPNSVLNVSDGEIFICGQYSGLKMLDWSASASVSITGGTINLRNAQSGSTNNVGSINFKGHTINNLVIDRNAASTGLSVNTDNVVIAGDLTIESGSTFLANDLNFTLHGDFINNATFTPGSGTVTLKGSDKEITGNSSTNFNNLIFDNNSSYTITPTTGDRINVYGDLTLNTGSVLNISSGKMLDYYGDDAIISGDIVAVDNLDGTRDFDFNNTASLSCSGMISADLRIYNNQTSLASDIDLDGDLIINQATSDLNLGIYDISVLGSWTNNGVFTAGTGSVLFSGVSETIGGANKSTFYDLSFLDGASYTVNPTADRIEVTNNFLTETNSTLNLATGKKLSLFSSTNTINGNITTESSKYDEAVLESTSNFEIYIRRDNTLSGSGVIGADVLLFKDVGFSSTTTLGSDLTIDGSLWISNEWAQPATLVAGNHKLYVSGNWISNGVFNSETSTIVLNPTDNRKIRTFTPIASGVVAASNNFWNLTIAASADKTVSLDRDGSGTEDQVTNPYSGHLRVKNNLEVLSGTFSTGETGVAGRKLISNNVSLIEEGATLNIGGLATESNWGYFVTTFYGDIILKGNITTTRPLSSGFAEIFLMGARLKSSGTVDEFGCDVQIHTTAITTQESDVYIKGDLIIQDDGTLICESNKILTVNGNFYLYESLVHEGTVNVHGNMTSGGYVTNNVDIDESIFNFIQSGTKYVYLDKTINFGEVNILGGTREFRQDIDCASDLTITNGSIMDMYVTAPKNLSLSQSANFINSGSFVPYTNTVSFTGNSAQNITGSTQTTFYNLEVDNSGVGVYPQNIASVSNQLLLTNGVFNTTTSKYISLLDQSSVSPEGGQANSFVNGPIFKTGRDGVGGGYSFVFPTGKNGVWARIAAEHHSGTTAVSDQFMAEYFDYPYPVVDFDASIEAVSTVEYWNLAKITGNADLQKKVKLYSEDKNRSGIVSFTTDDDLTVAHFNTVTQKWEDIGLTGSNESGSTGWVISDFNDDFSPFTFGSKTGDNPLPIELLSFDAKLDETTVLCSWSTASEFNTDYFIVEKSVDMISFSDVGVLKAAGFSNQIQNYQLLDNQPFDNVSYYRLKSVDFDKSYSYSDIVAINNPVISKPDIKTSESTIEIMSLYPNPVKDEFYVIVNSDENVRTIITISDISGKTIYQNHAQLLLGTNRISLNAHNYTEGFYILSITDNKTVKSVKFVRGEGD